MKKQTPPLPPGKSPAEKKIKEPTEERGKPATKPGANTSEDKFIPWDDLAQLIPTPNK